MKLSGSPEVMAQKVYDTKPAAAAADATGAAGTSAADPVAAPEEPFQAKMFQLVYRNGHAVWK